jgi:hypothetical protein
MWQAALDPALLGRLLRPLARPGVIGQTQGRRILERLRHMAAGLPLLDKLAWYLNMLEDGAACGPFVYAVPAHAEVPPASGAVLPAETRPVVVARIPPAQPAPAATPPVRLVVAARAARLDPGPAPAAPVAPARQAEDPARAPGRPVAPSESGAPAQPAQREPGDEAPGLPAQPRPLAHPAKGMAPESPRRIVLPPAPRRAAPSTAGVTPQVVLPAQHAPPAPAAAASRAGQPRPKPTPSLPLARAHAARVGAERGPVVAPISWRSPDALARRLPVISVSALAPQPVAELPVAAPAATAQPAPAFVPTQAMPQRSAGLGAEPLPEGEAARLADRVYDLLVRRIAAERGRRGW